MDLMCQDLRYSKFGEIYTIESDRGQQSTSSFSEIVFFLLLTIIYSWMKQQYVTEIFVMQEKNAVLLFIMFYAYETWKIY